MHGFDGFVHGFGFGAGTMTIAFFASPVYALVLLTFAVVAMVAMAIARRRGGGSE